MFDVCIENLLEDTKQIATWARISGTKDELDSFGYIKNRLDEIGAATVLHSHDAYVSIPMNASLQVAGQFFECRTHSMSAVVDNLQARIVFGGKIATLTEDICKGNIVIVDGRAEREPVIKAYALGAVGVVCAAGEYIYESCLSPVWGSPSYKNKHLLPAIPVVSITVASCDEIKAIIQNDSTVQAVLSTEVESGWHKQPLLVAEIKAPVATEQFVMFSAHVDSWFYGAMDNGSANAVLLEVARVASKNIDLLKYNLRLVFFSGHSQGRYSGSSWYFDNNWEDLHYNCILSVNIDSPGAIGANDLTRSTIMPEAKPLAKRIIKEIADVEFVGRRYSRFADQSFWGTGVSCAFASFSKQLLAGQTTVGNFAIPVGGSLDLGWWWHTPADTFDKIDPDNLKRDASIFANYIMYYLCNRVVDLDFRMAIAEIREGLLAWQEKAGDQFDLQVAIERAERISLAMELFYANKPTEDSTMECITTYNKALWAMGRQLVRVNYTCGNHYQNDPAVPQPPIPALLDINRLVQASSKQERLEVFVELQRSFNYVLHSLTEVLNVLQKGESK